MLCTKTRKFALLCATSVFSVSPWLINLQQELTTENTEVAQRNQQESDSRLRGLLHEELPQV